MCLCGIALWRLLKHEPNWAYEKLKKWETFYGKFSWDLIKKYALAVVIPWYFLEWTFAEERNKRSVMRRAFTCIRFAVPFYLWIILLLLRTAFTNVDHVAWAVFVLFLVQGSMLRRRIRRRLDIEGNAFEDVALMVVYPITCVQMYEQLHIEKNPKHQNPQTGAANRGFNMEDREPPMYEEAADSGPVIDHVDV